MKPIFFTVAGIPKAQPRVKACRRGNHAGVYDPGTADDWKSAVRAVAYAAWDRVQIDEPVALYIVCHMPRPKSHFGKNGLKDSAPFHHSSKPDADNIAKAIQDALTDLGIWVDDSRISFLQISKRYADGPPFAEISIEPRTDA